MNTIDRFWLRTGRFSDEQVSIAIIVGYLAVIFGLAYLGWAVMR